MLPLFINLEKSATRRENMVKQLNEKFGYCVIVEAIDGLQLKNKSYRIKISKELNIPVDKLRPEYYLNRKNFHCLSKDIDKILPKIGCFLSHLKVLKIALDNNWDKILIMEDDIHIININQKNIDKNKDFDMIYLGAVSKNKLDNSWEKNGYFHLQDIDISGTFAYYLKSKEIIRKIYDGMVSVYKSGIQRMKYDVDSRLRLCAVDLFYRRYFHNNSIVLYPPPIAHNDNIISTIDTSKKYKKRAGAQCLSKIKIQ